MILKKITPENIKRLNWFDKVYELDNQLDHLNESPKIKQILRLFEVQCTLDLTQGKYFFSNAVKYY
jgi:hypothetical protein